MNREIKFRAWNRRTNKMLEWDFLLRIMNNTGGGGASVFKSSELILMQFTGLLDKNGKEIYEGDVVKVSHDQFDWEHTGDVRFEEGRFFVNADGYVPGLTSTSHVYEIIGNIYQHPELLQTNK